MHNTMPTAVPAEGAEPLNIAGKLARMFLHSKITLLIIIALFLTGLLALAVTPREYNPKIVVPAANIIVAKPGASPDEVRRLIVRPLGAIMNAMSGVDHTYGYATQDMGLVTVQFKVGEDQEDSLVKLYNQLMQNMDRMPAGTLQPLVKPINVDDVPILTIALGSAQYDDMQLREIGSRLIEHLRNVPGVSFTEVVGGRPRAVNVWLDPQRLEARGLTLDQVSMMLQGTNVSAPLGELDMDNRAIPLRLEGFLRTAEEAGDIVVGVSKQGRPIYLKDVARIEDGPAEVEQVHRLAYGPAHPQAEGDRRAGSEMPAVTLVIAKKAGTNAVVVAEAVLAKLEELKRQALPAGVDVVVTRNDGAKADEAVNTLIEHLGIAVGSVILILILFLGWREAGIVTLTVPLILFVVLAVGLVFGQTINRITLFALILSLGLLVDAAIVVIENIHRHMHSGQITDFSATLIRATNEIGNPTNIATIAVILAFIPMAFVTGMMGPFMRPIPFNVPVAMIASLVIAYMVVPWATRLWLGKKVATMQALAATPSLEERGHDKKDVLHRLYVGVITPLLNRRALRWITMLVVIALLFGAMLMPAWQFIRPAGMNGPLSPLGVELKMLPNDNTSTLLLQVDMPAGTSLAATDQVARAVGQVLARQPHVTDYSTFTGMTAPIDFAALVRGDMIKRGSNLAQIRVNLVGKHERSESSHTIAEQLDVALNEVRAAFPQAKLKIYETPPGPPVQAQILAELYGPDYDKLREAAPHVDAAFAQIFGMINVDDSVTAHAESLHIHVDAEKAMLSGIAPGQVAKLLRDYVSGLSIGTLHVEGAREPVDITLRLPRELRTDPASLLTLRISNPQGVQVPLSAIATVERVTQAKPYYGRDQHSMVMVGGELLRSSPVYAVLSLDKMLDGVELPNGVKFTTGNLGFVQAQPKDVMEYTLLWGGEMRLTLDVFRDLGSAFIVAIILIYLMLVAYYKSFMLPFIVMGAIPLTMVGIFPGHWFTGQAFTATSMIGLIALAGIVVRNSLLLIDFILDYRRQGYSLEAAVIEAGAVRFRPILLTALAIILGSLIMITDPVFGGLAVSLIFGTFASTLLTLVVIPLMYWWWQRPSRKVTG
ncbi:efflux RND transporter permease subunit [Thiofaba sp. EF100]|uniref:efflux RND transporter permease subunit n=1 Tax=Thiofaba sp. EF100 TaxID=3121274 RepID=UPI003222081A